MPVGCALFLIGIYLYVFGGAGLWPNHGFFPNLLSGSAVLVPSFIPQVYLTPVQSATTVPPQQWTIGKALNNPALRLGHFKPGTRRKEKANTDLQ